MDYLSFNFKDYFLDFFSFALILFSVYQLGLFTTSRFLKWDGYFEFKLEREVFALALGLTLFSLTVLAAGTFGFLNKNVFIFILFIFAFFYLANKKLQKKLRLKKAPTALSLALAIASIAFIFSFLQCFVPPISNDALAYHLAHPKAFVESGRVAYLPNSRESLWPYQMEMLFTLGLLLRGTALAQLFHWLFYPLTALLCFFLAERIIKKGSGIWALLVFVFTPAVFAQSSQAYVDVAFAFYIFASLYLFCLHKNPKAAFASGLFSGAALGIKYLALGSSAVMAVLWLWAGTKRLKSFFYFALGALLIGAVWYLRSWIILGNPVYPFFSGIFGGQGYATSIGNVNGLGKTPLAYLMLLWNLTFKPALFGGEIIGPAYLLFLPFLLGVAKKISALGKYLLFFCSSYSIFLFTQSQQVRFFISLLPVLALGAGYAIYVLVKKDSFIKNTTIAFMTALLLCHSALFIYRSIPSLKVLIGHQSERDYLLERERSFAFTDFLNAHALPDQKIFNTADIRSFYSEIPTVVDGEPLRNEWLKKKISLEYYLERQRFDFIATEENPEPDMQKYLNEKGYKKIYSRNFTEGESHYSAAVWSLHPDQSSKLVLQGDAYCRSGQYRKALEKYEASFSYFKNNPGGRFNYGLALKRNGMPEKALLEYAAALELSPAYVEVLLERGKLRLKLSKAGVFQDFERAAQLAPANSQAHFWYAQILRKTGHLPEAINEYQQSLKLWPRSSEARWGLTQAYLGQAKPLLASRELFELLCSHMTSNDI